jgi:hypothetical protein
MLKETPQLRKHPVLLGIPEISLISPHEYTYFNHLSEVNLNMRRLFGFLIMLFTLLVLNICSVDFLKYLCFREDGRYPPIGYSQTILLEHFSFKSLSERK